MFKMDTFTYDNEDHKLLSQDTSYRKYGWDEERFLGNGYKVINKEENGAFLVLRREATEEHNFVSVVVISSLLC